VGFEPTIPVLEQTKKVHALDSVGTVIGSNRGLFEGINRHCLGETEKKKETLVVLRYEYLEVVILTCTTPL
jgi:hypothetical protein